MVRKIKDNPISFRLSKEKRIFYELEAAKEGLGLSIYLKQKLERDESITSSSISLQRSGSLRDDHLTRLLPIMQKSIEFIEKNDSETNRYRAMLLEILLLLRCTIQPQKVNMVQTEVKRRGLEIWTSDSWGKIIEKDDNDER